MTRLPASKRTGVDVRRGVRGRARLHQAGFTLVELMIVVVIVGILAVLAVVGFRKLIGQARSAEAHQMINAIRVAQEAYHAETGTYADISSTLAYQGTEGSLYPQGSVASRPTNPGNSSFVVGDFKVGWGGPCNTGCNAGIDWFVLPVHTEGGVMYGYTTRAGLAGSNSYINGGTVTKVNMTSSVQITLPAPPTADWFLITAVGDENMDGVPAVYLGSSFSNDILVQNEGE
ncbi:MAG TPA: prepilin-type N-terminal cleavage/methylation domain-containing protein [Polyangiaceae bacterium]